MSYFYCNAKGWEYSEGSGVQITTGRTTLYSLVSQGRQLATSNNVKSVVLKDGSASGSVNYKVAFPQMHYTTAWIAQGHAMNYQVNLGLGGILFPNGIYFELGTTPGTEIGINRLLFLYT